MKAQNALMKASAETLHTVERAVIKMTHAPPGIVWATRNRYEISLSAKNFGNTPGRVTATVMKPIIVKQDERLPPVPDYRYDTDTHYSYANYSQGTEAFLVQNDKIFFPHHHDGINRDEIIHGAKRLYVIGYVDYIDSFGVRHRGGYARMYLPKFDDRAEWPDGEEGTKLFAERSNLVFVPQPRYNYDRKREKGEGEDWDEETYGKAPQ